jgi:short-subunit dehydrogenase
VLIDVEAEPLASASAELARRFGIKAEPLILDLGSDDTLERVVRATEGRDIGLLVYNAAVSSIGRYLEEDLTVHERLLAVNCRAPAGLVHHFGRQMRGRGHGGIVLMSSLSGFQGNPMLAQYAATKAYNLVLAESLWDECRDDGVDVLACCPGATLTPSYLRARPPGPAPRFPREMQPRDVVEAALAALGRGPTVIPGLANRFAAVLVQRLLPRRRAIELMGRVGRTLQRKQPD